MLPLNPIRRRPTPTGEASGSSGGCKREVGLVVQLGDDVLAVQACDVGYDHSAARRVVLLDIFEQR